MGVPFPSSSVGEHRICCQKDHVSWFLFVFKGCNCEVRNVTQERNFLLESLLKWNTKVYLFIHYDDLLPLLNPL